MKIMKKPEPPKEKKLAVPKAMRSSNWKLAMVEDDMELDDEGDQKTEDAVLVRVEDNPEKEEETTKDPKEEVLGYYQGDYEPRSCLRRGHKATSDDQATGPTCMLTYIRKALI